LKTVNLPAEFQPPTPTKPNQNPSIMKKQWFLWLAIGLALFSFTKKKPTPKLELGKQFKNKFVYIPDGKFKTENGEEKISAFFLSATEISNQEYKTFISALKATGNAEALQLALPDTTQWRQSSAYNEPYVQYYFSHPAYNPYPVCNVSYEGALLYCSWLQDKLNQENKNASIHYQVRLPKLTEWQYAAHGGLQGVPYAWGGPYISNAQGCPLCNFASLGAENIHFNEETQKYEVLPGVSTLGVAGYLNDNADITAPVYAYSPNNYGLFNMNGNIAEMVAEKGIACGGSWRSSGYDVRNESTIHFDGPTPTVGFRVVVEVGQKLN